jgi:hypothetical protein
MKKPRGKLPLPSISDYVGARYRWVAYIITRGNVIFGAYMAKEKPE